MAGSGAVRAPQTRKRLEQACPRLRERSHGTWSFHCSVTTMFGGRERVRRGGYATRRDAETARDEVLEQSRAERITATSTTGRWLRHWLTTRTSIRSSTLRDKLARFIELPTPRRPQPQVWTNHRVDA